GPECQRRRRTCPLYPAGVRRLGKRPGSARLLGAAGRAWLPAVPLLPERPTPRRRRPRENDVRSRLAADALRSRPLPAPRRFPADRVLVDAASWLLRRGRG